MDSSFAISTTSSPTNIEADSQAFNSEFDNESSQQPTQTSIVSDKAKSIRDSIYNRAEYTLEPDIHSKVYIFKNGLFTRTLLPIDLEKEREMEVKCTT